MQWILVGILAASAYNDPTPLGDFHAFLRFMWADERCSEVNINYERTFDQVREIASSMGWDNDQRQQAILAGTRAAMFQYDFERADFCQTVSDQFNSYDPSYLRKIGIID
ncbi:hypothetical protein P9A16_32660 [Shinella sp. 838]|uniref:hypothetical protein n=1 Tax=Shinella sp. 838 TaxID=3038164 RepID=UPI0024156258|nr:hypothetical protein [Shinella sp. 838]MDG4675854.1 hypothetical protein [Shinella sp. 838]